VVAPAQRGSLQQRPALCHPVVAVALNRGLRAPERVAKSASWFGRIKETQMRLPIIKDGIVVNVIEIDEATAIVDKATHANLCASEEADYAQRYAEWQTQVAAVETAIAEARTQHFMASGIAVAVKTEAKGVDVESAPAMLDKLLVAEAEVEAWAAKIADMQAQPLPEKPKLIRTARWMYPEGHIVGPEGGEIGDSWNGNAYIKPVVA
jgi:hypothetical protein